MKLGDYATFKIELRVYFFGKIVTIRRLGKIVTIRRLIEKRTSKKYTNVDIETVSGSKHIEIPLENVKTYD